MVRAARAQIGGTVGAGRRQRERNKL